MILYIVVGEYGDAYYRYDLTNEEIENLLLNEITFIKVENTHALLQKPQEYIWNEEKEKTEWSDLHLIPEDWYS